MTKLTLIKPEVGGKNTTEEPKVGNAFTAIEQVVNGELDSSNIKNESLEEVDFAAAVKTLLAQKVSGLTIRTSTISTTAANGELIEMLTNAGNTVTLPSPTTVGLTVGIVTPLVSSKLKTPSGLIIGDGFSAATLTFAAGQHATVIADGANYFIIAGEPKREQVYSGFTLHTKVEMEAGVEISASRPAMASVRVEGAWSGTESVSVGGKAAAIVAKAEAGSNPTTVTVYVPPGQKIVVVRVAEISAILQ